MHAVKCGEASAVRCGTSAVSLVSAVSEVSAASAVQ